MKTVVSISVLLCLCQVNVLTAPITPPDFKTVTVEDVYLSAEGNVNTWEHNLRTHEGANIEAAAKYMNKGKRWQKTIDKVIEFYEKGEELKAAYDNNESEDKLFDLQYDLCMIGFGEFDYYAKSIEKGIKGLKGYDITTSNLMNQSLIVFSHKMSKLKLKKYCKKMIEQFGADGGYMVGRYHGSSISALSTSDGTPKSLINLLDKINGFVWFIVYENWMGFLPEFQFKAGKELEISPCYFG